MDDFCVCVAVNYRGSLGFGQDNIDSLPGNIGTQDVKDVQVKHFNSLMGEVHAFSLLCV